MFKILDLNSIRSRMVSGFLFLIILILLLALVSLYLLDRTGRIANIHGHISQLEVRTLLLFKNDNDFFDLESTNTHYFDSHQSTFLTRRDSLLKHVRKDIVTVFKETANKSYAIDKDLVEIGEALELYDEKFHALEELVYKRGLKDYGIEGEMRIHAHLLEESNARISLDQILTLRRHEKDFLLRKDTNYISLFRTKADGLLQKLENTSNHTFGSYHLREYRRLFLALSEVEKQIGLTSSEGLRHELNDLTFSISNKYLALAQYSYRLSSSAQQQARIIYSVLLVSAVVFAIISGMWISRRLSAPIAALSKQVRAVNGGVPGARVDYNLKNAANEIQTLAKAFHQLIEKSELQMAEIKEKSRLVKEQNKELKKLNHELDNFLYSTAHDLRSPLTSLSGLLNLFKYESERAHINKYVDMMQSSIGRMEEFIAQIVDYSKNKSVELNVIGPLDLRKIIGSIIDSHRFMEGARHIEWIVHLNDSSPVFSDINRFYILFNNLISNAIKYADASKPKRYVRIQIDTTLDSIRIEFLDNGIGIGAEHLEKIFDMFYRADTTSKGSGLGLYIFKQTILRLKGNVGVDSKQGIGTRFVITLPNQNEVVVRSEVAVPL